MKSRAYARDSKGRFAKLRYARKITVKNTRHVDLTRKNLQARKKLLTKVKRRARNSFSERIKKQLPTKARARASKKRIRHERKTLYVPGAKQKSFEIEKFYFEVRPPIKLGKRSYKRKTLNAFRVFRADFLKIFDDNKGRDFLFRIDTAYSDSNGFSRVEAHASGKKETSKHGDSDGRGFSIGRVLEISTRNEFKGYIRETFQKFFRAFETYMSRKGMVFGQLNAFTLEVS